MNTLQKITVLTVLVLGLAACNATTVPIPPVTSVPEAVVFEEDAAKALAERRRTKNFLPGDSVLAVAYCIGEDPEFIKEFTAALVRGGVDKYWALLREPSIPCFDMRIHQQFSPPPVVLKEKLWRLVMPSGEELDVWLIEDRNSARGYTWIQRISIEDARGKEPVGDPA